MLTATNYKYKKLTTSKIARFINVDPLQFKYAYYTPFQYAGNKPVSFIDLDGAEEAKKDSVKLYMYFYEDKSTPLFESVIEDAFDNNINVKVSNARDNRGRNIVQFHKTDKKLSSSQEGVFNRLKVFEKVNYDLELNVAYERKAQLFDSYTDKTLYLSYFKNMTKQSGILENMDLMYIYHFFEEQFQSQNYSKEYENSHDKAIEKGIDIFGYSWEGYIDPDIGISENFFLDNNGEYIGTLVGYFDESEKGYSEEFIDDKAGYDKYMNIMNNYDLTYGEYGNALREYHINHSLPEFRERATKFYDNIDK